MTEYCLELHIVEVVECPSGYPHHGAITTKPHRVRVDVTHLFDTKCRNGHAVPDSQIFDGPVKTWLIIGGHTV